MRLREILELLHGRDAAMKRARLCRDTGREGIADDVRIARTFNRLALRLLRGAA